MALLLHCCTVAILLSRYCCTIVALLAYPPSSDYNVGEASVKRFKRSATAGQVSIGRKEEMEKYN